MKKFIDEFIRHFFATPMLPLLVILCTISAMALTSDGPAKEAEIAAETSKSLAAVQQKKMSSMTTTSTAATSTTTTSTSTTSTNTTTTTETTTTTTTTTTEAAPERPTFSDYTIFMGAESPNSAYYQERLTIVGDSIAYGFNAYGYIPAGHNIAKESLALWNLGKYTFDMGGGAMGVVDAAAYTDSSLFYLSIGMNDIFTYSPDGYAASMVSLAQQIVDAVPDTTVVIGSITPVSENNYYTDNATIQQFNYALENAVYAYGSPQIHYFNAYAVLADPNTNALAAGAGGGDGLHLAGSSYGYILNSLFNYLDTTDTITRIEAHDSKYAQ